MESPPKSPPTNTRLKTKTSKALASKLRFDHGASFSYPAQEIATLDDTTKVETIIPFEEKHHTYNLEPISTYPSEHLLLIDYFI